MKLNGSIDDDIRLGYTLWGAHRDDLVIKINGMNKYPKFISHEKLERSFLLEG